MSFKFISVENPGWTPQSLFFSLNPKEHSVLLQSGRFHPKTARYSYLCLEPSAFLKVHEKKCHYQSFETSEKTIWEGNPFLFLKEKIKETSQTISSETSQLPPFSGGAIGVIGYEGRLWTEPIALTPKPNLELPDMFFLFFNWGIALDHFENKILLFAQTPHAAKIDALIEQVSSKPKQEKKKEGIHFPLQALWQSNFSQQEFCAIVEKAKNYIAAGDIFQVNLAQMFSCQSEVDGGVLFSALNEVNPSPFSAYFKTPDFEIISCSPERLIRMDGKNAETRPIAGTRPRLPDFFEDSQLEQELQKNKKERAEHIMLLDLERNDLGRVSQFGSVEVTEFLAVENYSHVRHLVSNVKSILKAEHDAFDLFKAMFPGGTITGTPKVRAMQIIEELETVGRHFYTGSLGYFSYTGKMDFNILIRTFIKKKNHLYLHAGAGIVADSVPEKEYEETWHKAKALMKALTLAETLTKA